MSLSTFLVIGATSSLTYNVVGHIKTVIILMGGCMFFGDEMPLKKLAGISVAMSGIIWYSQVRAPLPVRSLSCVLACRLVREYDLVVFLSYYWGTCGLWRTFRGNMLRL